MLRGLRGKTPASLSLERLPGEGRADAGTLSSGWAEAGPGAFLAGLDAGRQPGLGEVTGPRPFALKKEEDREPTLPVSEPGVTTTPSKAEGLETGSVSLWPVYRPVTSVCPAEQQLPSKAYVWRQTNNSPVPRALPQSVLISAGSTGAEGWRGQSTALQADGELGRPNASLTSILLCLSAALSTAAWWSWDMGKQTPRLQISAFY